MIDFHLIVFLDHQNPCLATKIVSRGARACGRHAHFRQRFGQVLNPTTSGYLMHICHGIYGELLKLLWGRLMCAFWTETVSRNEL